ncbi:MAG TPA: TetR/AcrR family transcriptional regulator, partial [Longimicrobiales bacterium]|nr:TetR/AcrR family transcriptional regulator [Longimicrobiales bacterium]
RRRILDSALELFGRQGYSATSVRQIARAAGVSPSLLYNYFDGKETLLGAIFLESMRHVQASLDQAAGGAGRPERVDQLVHGALAAVRDGLPFWRVLYRLRGEPEVIAGLGVHLRTWTESIRESIRSLLESSGSANPGAEALALFAAIDGIAQHYALDPERYPLDEVADALVQRFAPAGTAAPEPAR